LLLPLATILLVPTAGSLPAPGAARSEPDDVVELRDGERLVGRVVYEDEEVVVLRNGRREAELASADVVSVRSVERSLGGLLREAAEHDPWSVDANRTLAHAAAGAGLSGEAAVFWWRVLARAPDDAEANEALGHRDGRAGWTTRVGTRQVPLEARRELARDWGSAWELETSHWRLRTNLGLEEATDLALDLERLYRGFFVIFQRELRLYAVTEPLDVHVHADASSYPEQGGERGYFDRDDRTLRMDSSGGLDRWLLVHEATHQLVHRTSELEPAYRGDVPAWLDEGLAEYVAACAVGDPGRLDLEAGRVQPVRFATHANAAKPLDLSRVLNLGPGDFAASTDRELKYAQAYTLVHFGLHGEHGRFRDEFLSFVRGAYRGKGSSTHFKKAFPLRERELGEHWAAWAKANAGG